MRAQDTPHGKGCARLTWSMSAHLSHVIDRRGVEASRQPRTTPQQIPGSGDDVTLTLASPPAHPLPQVKGTPTPKNLRLPVSSPDAG